MFSSDKFKYNIFKGLKQVNPYTGDLFFFTLMDDKFGNYVLQKMFDNADTRLQNEIFSLIQNSDMHRWKQSKYGTTYNFHYLLKRESCYQLH